MRREILVPLFVIGVVGAGLGATTVALYTDSDLSTGNTIDTKSLDLRLDGSDSLSSSFSISGGLPGDSASHTFDITNVGGTTADHVEVDVSFSESDPGAEPSDSDLNAELTANEMASLVEVTTFEYQNDTGTTITNVLSSTTDDNGNGIIDLDDLDNSLPLDDQPAPQANTGNTTKLAVGVQLANDDDGSFVKGGNTAGGLTGYDEDHMGDGVDVTVTVTLNQDASQ